MIIITSLQPIIIEEVAEELILQAYFSCIWILQATKTVAFLTVHRFYNSLLFIKLKIYKPDILAREGRITVFELGPFWERGVGGTVLCSPSRS